MPDRVVLIGGIVTSSMCVAARHSHSRFDELSACLACVRQSLEKSHSEPGTEYWLRGRPLKRPKVNTRARTLSSGSPPDVLRRLFVQNIPR